MESFGYRPTDPGQATAAQRNWWDRQADDYLAEHGDFLGPVDLCWCPEGLRESQAGLLGDVAGALVVEVGCGAAQGSRWVAEAGGRVVGVDLSGGMLRQARRLACSTGVRVPLVQAEAGRLPFADAAFDVAFSAFGALPFVPDASAIHREVARVLRPGGRWIWAVPHPIRWAFPDDPGPRGLRAQRSYFDRTPYAEIDDGGRLDYVEYHRTLGDHIRDLVSAGFELRALIEPQWQAGDAVWGGWSALRGQHLPGTAIFVCRTGA